MANSVSYSNINLREGYTRRLIQVEIYSTHIKIHAHIRKHEQFYATDPNDDSQVNYPEEVPETKRFSTDSVSQFDQKRGVKFELSKDKNWKIVFIAHENLSGKNVTLSTDLFSLINQVIHKTTEDGQEL